MGVSAAAAGHGREFGPDRAGFQPEIQGMRALSVLGVVLAHGAVPGLAGGFTGVDVFFVISGFLITRLLLAEHARTGRIDLLGFWARRARRLLPNAYATMLGTVLLALFLFPGYDPATLAKEIAFAALEIVNFLFADRETNYFDAGGVPSPLLHFWSLAVEEQFYAIWPVLLVLATLLLRQPFRRSAAMLLALIWCASFLASVMLTPKEPALAYFGTGTRCWQLATGALLAVGWDRVEALPGRLRAAMAWAGLAAILAGVLLIQEGRGYPGFWALLPTLGAAGLLAGFGGAPPRGALRRGLGLPAMQWLGARSYSWYLWHWPLLALPRITFPDSAYTEIVAIPASLAVASLAYRWVEQPFRGGQWLPASPMPTLAGAVAGLAMIIGAGHLYGVFLPLVDKEIAARVATMAEAKKDRPKMRGCTEDFEEGEPARCDFGEPTSLRRVVLFGDSHAAHWFPAIEAAATQTGWRLRVYAKPGCPSADIRRLRHDRPYQACDEWRATVIDRLTGAERPDAVILSNRTDYHSDMYDPLTGDSVGEQWGDSLWQEGFRRTIGWLLDAGIKVIVIRDVPRAPLHYALCHIRGGECTTPRDVALEETKLDLQVAREFGDRVMLIDFTDEFCNASICRTNKDGRVIYRDDDHLAASFAATLAPQMTRHLQRLAGETHPASAANASASVVVTGATPAGGETQ
jgi:peptidoglycan/LPS O-acetylase OafA/YrhL